MTITTGSSYSIPDRWWRAAIILARAAFGLFAHGLINPGQRAVIDRATGRVAVR
jgi:hypothetical protein